MSDKTYETITVERDHGIVWITLNRPDKRNAMSPQLDTEMLGLLIELESDPDCRVVVLTGAGEAWCAGMDLKLYFRALEDDAAARAQAFWTSHQWRWHRLYTFPKPTIAMVNGFCFGGAFTQLIACDFAIAAEDAMFGLSEVNWGIIPGGMVSKVVELCLGYRDSLYYGMTGEAFDAKAAERARLINKAVPTSELKAETRKLAEKLLSLNPDTLRSTKEAMKLVRGMTMEQATDYLMAKDAQLKLRDRDNGYKKGISRFIDEKAYRPGLGSYTRADGSK